MSAPPGMPARPLHLRWRLLLLVGAGGAIGTALRQGLSAAVPSPPQFPLAIFTINVLGAAVLGLLLEVLALRGPDEGRRRDIRLLVGTGVLGGFTTYSSLATASAQLVAGGDWAWAFAYALGTVVVGGAASLLGIEAGRRIAHGGPGEGGAGGPGRPGEGGAGG